MSATAVATSPLDVYRAARGDDGGFAMLWRPPGVAVEVAVGVDAELAVTGAGRFATAADAVARWGRRSVACFGFGDDAPTGPWSGVPAGLVLAPRAWESWPAHTHVGSGATIEGGALALTSLPTPAGFARNVASAVAAIRAGEATKVVLTRCVRIDGLARGAAGAAVSRLASASPGCTVFAFGRDDWDFVGATPELLLGMDGAVAVSQPMAGTVPTDGDADVQARAVAALVADPKQRHEHSLVVDAVAEAFARHCTEWRADAEPAPLALANVVHLGSRVQGRTCTGTRPLDLVGSLHPTPAVGAVPDAALALATRFDAVPRGLYCGPIGWTDGRAGDFRVALRCALVRGSTAWLFAGAGVVASSDPAEETRETQWKLRPLLDAFVSTHV